MKKLLHIPSARCWIVPLTRLDHLAEFNDHDKLLGYILNTYGYAGKIIPASPTDKVYTGSDAKFYFSRGGGEPFKPHEFEIVEVEDV